MPVRIKSVSTSLQLDAQISEIQKLQMVTQEGDNVGVCAVKGNFDDAQNAVKRIFSDEVLRKDLEEKGYFLSL